MVNQTLSTFVTGQGHRVRGAFYLFFLISVYTSLAACGQSQSPESALKAARIRLTLDRIDCIGHCERDTNRGEFTWNLRVGNQVVSERFRRLNDAVKLEPGQNIFPNESEVVTVGPNFQVKAILEEWDDPNDLWLDRQAAQTKDYTTGSLPRSDTLEVVPGPGCGLRFAFSFHRG